MISQSFEPSRGRAAKVLVQKLLRAVEAEKQGLKNRVWPHLDYRAISFLACSPEEFCEYFFVFAWEICIEKWRGFWWIFSGLRLPRNEARKILEKFGEASEQNSGQNSGRKFENFGKLSFCNFPDWTRAEVQHQRWKNLREPLGGKLPLRGS